MSSWNPMKDAKKAVESIANGGRDAINQVQGAANSAKHGIEDTANSAKHGIEAAANDGRHGIEAAANSAKHGIEDTATAAKHDITDAAQKVQDTAEKLPGMAAAAVQTAVEELVEAFSAAGLRRFRSTVKAAKRKLDALHSSKPELIGEIDQVGVYLQLGPLTLTWEEFYSRAEHVIGSLDEFVSSPPGFHRRPVLDLIRGIGPTSIDAGISVQFALVVGSDELGVGGGLNGLRLALFLEVGDVVLEELGVPE